MDVMRDDDSLGMSQEHNEHWEHFAQGSYTSKKGVTVYNAAKT